MDISNKALRLSRTKHTHIKGCKFPMEKRIEVVTKTLALGNMRLVSELTGVSYALVREWKTMPWWKELEAEIKASRRSVVDTKLSRIVDKALAVIEDRLDNGDPFYDQKTGKIVRKPVSIKEARGAANDLMQRQATLVKQEQDEKVADSQVSINDQLALLAQQFAAFNTKRTVEVVPNAVHEERETRLQDGERKVQQPSGTGEGTNGTQPGEGDDGESGFGFQRGREGRGSQDTSEQGRDELEEQFEDGEQDGEPQFLAELERQLEEST